MAILEDDEYAKLMAKKVGMPKTRFGDAIDAAHLESINKLTEANMK